MKKSIATLLTSALAIISLIASPTAAFAAGTQDITDISGTPVNVPVTANISNNYTVTIPTNIDFGNSKQAEYTVSAKGDVSASTIINIAPEGEFQMSYLLKNVTATVTQDKKKWICSDVTGNSEGTSVNGTISAPDLTAGNWSGNLKFNITITNAAYVADNGSAAYTWDELVAGDYVLVDGGALTKNTNFDSLPAGSLAIPSDVTSFGTNAFHACTNLTGVSIPETITTIGASCFSNCTSLKNVKLPSNLTTIGDSAFSGCSLATGLRVPRSVTTIGANAFSGIDTVYYSGSAEGSKWGATTISPYTE